MEKAREHIIFLEMPGGSERLRRRYSSVLPDGATANLIEAEPGTFAAKWGELSLVVMLPVVGRNGAAEYVALGVIIIKFSKGK